MIQYEPVTERLWVKRQYRSIGSYEDYETLKSIIKEIDKALKAGDIKEVTLEISSGDYGDSQYMYFFAKQLETDFEMQTRIAAEKKNHKAREDFERKQYEALKAKYGP